MTVKECVQNAVLKSLGLRILGEIKTHTFGPTSLAVLVLKITPKTVKTHFNTSH